MIASASSRVYGSTSFFTALGLSKDDVGFLVIRPSSTAVLKTLDSLMMALLFTPTKTNHTAEHRRGDHVDPPQAKGWHSLQMERAFVIVPGAFDNMPAIQPHLGVLAKIGYC